MIVVLLISRCPYDGSSVVNIAISLRYYENKEIMNDNGELKKLSDNSELVKKYIVLKNIVNTITLIPAF